MEFRMAWRNVWRHPRRTLLTVSAIAFATVLLVFMLSWQFGSYYTMITSAVMVHTGYLQVLAKGYQEKQSMRLVVPEPASVARIVEQVDGVTAYAFRARAFSLVSSKDRTYGAMVVGIEPDREAEVSTLKSLIRKGEFLSPGDSNEALLGRLLAKNLKVDLGDEVVLLGQGRDGSIAATVVKVKGIFSSGQDEFDRGVLHIPLPVFQDVYTMRGAVHEVVIKTASLDDVKRVKDELTARLRGFRDLVVKDWSELMPGLIEAIKMDLVSGFIFYIILIVVVAFSILNTFLMVIFERTKEFGVMMALGTTPGRLTRILLMESMTMALIGITVGIGLGIVVTLFFQSHGILISGASELLSQFGLPERMFPRLSFLSATIGPAVVLVITFFTALYPAVKVRRMPLVEALTHG